MVKCAVPLLLVFIVQCLVVAAAFVAVILVLSLQQQQDFQDTLYSQLELRMDRTRQNVLTPVLQEEALLNGLADEVALNMERRATIGDDVDTLDALRDFFNGGRNIMQYAPRTIYIAQYQRSSTTRAVYKGVDMPFYNLAIVQNNVGGVILCRNLSFNLIGVPKVGVTYPMKNLTTDMAQSEIPFDSPASLFPILDPDHKDRAKREWSTANVVFDTTTFSLLQAYIVSLAGTPRSSITNATDYLGHGISIVVDLNSLLPLVVSSTFTPEGTTVLFENRKKTILAGKVSFALIDPVLQAPYTIPMTPDGTLNRAFSGVDARCGANLLSPCNSTIFIMEDGNEEYIVTAVRIRTESKLDMFLMQYNKRSYFFSRFENGLNRGIIIGVCAAVLVVISCILIWLAIVRPIRHLQDQMGQAAMMRNQEAADASDKQGGSVLREMENLHRSFVAMNNKLLQARPYLPQALLITTDDRDVDDDGEDLDGDESQSRQSLLMRSNTSQNSSSQFSTTGSILSVSQNKKGVSSHKERAASYANGSGAKNGHHSSSHEGVVSGPGSNTGPIVTRRIATLMVNTSGFHIITECMSAPETARLIASLVTVVEGAVRNERGIVDSFHGDHFTVSFNTARLVGTALRNAAVCALQVESAVLRQTPFKRVSMGLAGGRAMVGNMGNSSMMKLCALGPAYGQATLLEMIAQSNLRRFGQETGCCLISESSAREVEAYVGSHTVGWMKQANKAHPKAKSANSYQAPLVLNILNAVVATRNEEWMYAITKDSSSKNEGAVDDASMEEVHRVANLLSSQVNKCIRHGMKAHCAGSVVNGGGAGDVSSNHSRMSPEDEGLGAIPDFSDTHHINNGSRSTSILGNSTTNITPFSTKYNSLRNKALEVADVVAPTIRQKYKESCQRLASSSNAVKPEMRSLLLGNDSDSEGSMSPQLQDDSQSIRSDVTFNGGSFSPLMLPIGSSSRPGPSTSPHHGGITNAELLSRNPVETGIIGDTKSMSGSALIEMHRVNVPHHEVSSFALNSDCDPICPLRGNRSNTTTPRLNTSGVQTFGVLQPLQLHKSNITSTTRRPFHFSSYRGLSHSERYILQSVDLLEFATSYMEVADALKLQMHTPLNVDNFVGTAANGNDNKG